MSQQYQKMSIDKLEGIVTQNNTYKTIKMKPANVKSVWC